MWTTDLRIRTVFDLGKALRNGDPALWFPGFAELNAWNTIDKHVGRPTGERLTEQTLRRLEIRVADHSGLEMYILARKPLSEFAALCDGALVPRGAGARGSRRNLDQQLETDPLDIARTRESLVPQERAGNRQGSPTTDLERLLAALRPADRKAYFQRLYAQSRCSDWDPEQPDDKAAHEWLTEHGDEEGERPATLETWTRYLRKARHVLRQLSVANRTTTLAM